MSLVHPVPYLTVLQQRRVDWLSLRLVLEHRRTQASRELVGCRRTELIVTLEQTLGEATRRAEIFSATEGCIHIVALQRGWLARQTVVPYKTGSACDRLLLANEVPLETFASILAQFRRSVTGL